MISLTINEVPIKKKILYSRFCITIYDLMICLKISQFHYWGDNFYFLNSTNITVIHYSGFSKIRYLDNAVLCLKRLECSVKNRSNFLLWLVSQFWTTVKWRGHQIWHSFSRIRWQTDEGTLWWNKVSNWKPSDPGSETLTPYHCGFWSQISNL